MTDQDVADAKDARDSAKSDADAADKAAQDADGAAKQAQSDADAAKDAKDAADDDVTAKQQDKDAADVNVEKVQSALDDANAKLDKAKQAAEDNAAAIADAQQKLDEANAALSKAKASASDANAQYESATSAANTAQNAVNSAQSALNAATDRQHKAADAVTAAENALALAQADASTNFADTTAGKQAQQAVDAANAELAAANTQKEAAQKSLDDANATLTAAQDTLKKLQESSSTKVTYEENARGFFKYMGNETAVKLLTDPTLTGTDTTGKTFLSYTDLNDTEDATSLKNLARALNYIDECNKTRVNDAGQWELNVDLILMALAEINANWTYRNPGTTHAAYSGEQPHYEYYNEALGKTTTRNITFAENACGYGVYDPDENPYEPFQYWYDDEKAENGGHYQAIVGLSGVTGFGCNTSGKASGMYVAIQNFMGNPYGATDAERVSYTTDELRAKLKEFLALFSSSSDTDALTKAQQAVTDAQAAVASATSALSTATANVSAKQQALTTAQQAYDTAKQSY